MGRACLRVSASMQGSRGHFALFLSSVQLGWDWRAWASSRVLGRFLGSAGVGEEDPQEREMLRM